jgi:hypothetical protein
MPRVSGEQWRSLCAAAGVSETETDVGKVLYAAKQRLARRVDPRRRDAVVLAAVNAGRIPVSRVEFWSRAYEADPAGTEATLASLAAVAPSAASSAAGYPDPYGLGDVAHLFAPGSREEQEARWRWEDAQAGGLTDPEYEALFGPDK